jgi:hypothetical protein
MADSLRRLISRRFSLRQKAVALAPVLLLLVYLPGETLLRCRIDGLLRSTCCCPQKTESESAGPVVKAADCCNAEVTQNARPAAEVARPMNRGHVQVATTTFVVPSLPSLAPTIARIDRTAQRFGPAREGPPIVLLKHAFLI